MIIFIIQIKRFMVYFFIYISENMIDYKILKQIYLSTNIFINNIFPYNTASKFRTRICIPSFNLDTNSLHVQFT